MWTVRRLPPLPQRTMSSAALRFTSRHSRSTISAMRRPACAPSSAMAWTGHLLAKLLYLVERVRLALLPGGRLVLRRLDAGEGVGGGRVGPPERLVKVATEKPFADASLVLFDTTSTDFEGVGPKELASFGISRYKRGDRPQGHRMEKRASKPQARATMFLLRVREAPDTGCATEGEQPTHTRAPPMSGAAW